MTKETSFVASILIIDDEKDILKSMKDTLASENFLVETALTGKQGLDQAQKSIPDIILLDLRLPDMDGYDVCRQLKANDSTRHVPIIMVSTRSKDTEKVVGLEIGADDYLTKPYNPLELIARIRVALRRKNTSIDRGSNTKTGLLEKDLLVINTEGRSVLLDSKPIKLTRKEFDLLVFLVSKPGKAFNRLTIMESVWGYSFDSLQGTVDSHVKSLRKKLGKMGSWIETITGIGYRWKEDDVK
jgi:two-component system alkaline phosphatase synthesis response regulator PhoP